MYILVYIVGDKCGIKKLNRIEKSKIYHKKYDKI